MTLVLLGAEKFSCFDVDGPTLPRENQAVSLEANKVNTDVILEIRNESKVIDPSVSTQTQDIKENISSNKTEVAADISGK